VLQWGNGGCQFLLQKITFTKALRLSAEFPVKLGAVTLPVAVVVWVCVPSASPVNVGAATEPAGVKAAVLFEPSGVMLTLEL